MTLTNSADCHDPVCPQPHEARPAPTIDAELLADAIHLHRLAQYQRADAAYPGHFCLQECAEDIAAQYAKAAG